MEKIKIKINKKEKYALVFVDSELYSLESVYDAAYNFLDKAYVLLDGDPETVIKVQLRGKEEMDKDELENLANEFFNELINTGIREKIFKDNKKIREYIVSAALIGASKDLQERIRAEKEGVSLDFLEEDEEGWDEDPLGIATPWEEKHKNEDGSEGKK